MTVDGTEIAVVQFEEKDYISLTDMVRNIENGLALIEKWLRNKNTIEFLGISHMKQSLLNLLHGYFHSLNCIL
jgi:hypothetical protein